jgi:hypothetical protein
VNIDIFSNMEFGDPEGWKVFNLNHNYIHQTYSDLIVVKYNIQIASYDLSQANLGDRMQMQGWLQTHDQVHQAISQALNLGVSPDLETVDLTQKEQFYDWMYYHQLIHDQIDLILGVQ